ncbi:MAG: DNA-binding protein [Sedimenticola sp.]
MARPGVTRDQVFEAADALALEGQTPTVVAVRNRLGGGSPNTITPLLAEWKEQHELTHADALPPLPEQVESAMRQVWGAAWKETQAQLEAEREALSALRKELERERSEMLKEIEHLDEALETSKIEQQAGFDNLVGEKIAHDQTKAKAQEAKTLAKSELSHATKDANRERQAREKAEQVATELRVEVASLTEALSASKNELERETVRLDGAVEKLKHELQAGDDARESEKRAHEQTKARAQEAKALAKAELTHATKAEGLERKARGKAEKEAVDLRVEVASLTERAAQVQELKEMVEGLQGRLAELAKGERTIS